VTATTGDDATKAPPRPESRTRDHLANERTFLAWIRTALALIGLGFVLARLGLFLELALGEPGALGGRPHVRRTGHEFVWMGTVLMVVGTALAGWSARIHRRAAAAIDAGRFEPSRATAMALTVVVVAAGLVSVALVLWRTLALGR
jgi:putative membrane protein